MIFLMYQYATLLPVCYFLFIFPLVNSQPQPTPITSPCPVVLSPNSRIVGGTIADSSHMVYFRTTIGACSGTLITQTDILTARHCEIDTSTLAFISSTNGTDGTNILIRSVANHPRDDIMLVTLQSPANVEPVKILANPDLPSGWSFVRAQGYGIQSTFPFPSDSRQRFVDFPVIPRDICVTASSEVTVQGVPVSEDPAFPDDYICTGYLQSSSCTFCFGDSGGAVFSLLRGDPILVGVISRGNPLCSLPGSSGFSVRVSSYIGWLDEQGIQYDAVTELSETFVTPEGVTSGNGTPRVPSIVVQEVRVGLAPGAIAGIAVGAAAAVLIVVLAAVFVLRRKQGDNINPVAEAGESNSTPVATGSSLMPPDQPGTIPGQFVTPTQLSQQPPPPDQPGSIPGQFVTPKQLSQQPPQVPVATPAQGTQPLVQPQPPMQTAPPPSQLPAQQTLPAAYPMPSIQPPTQPPQPSQTGYHQ